MNKWVAIIGFIFWASISNAQIIEGQVVDADGNGLKSMIFLDGTNIQTDTNEKGYYNIKDIKAGNYRVVAFLPEYQSAFEDVTIRKGEVKSVVLQLLPMEAELEEVTISNSKIDQNQTKWLTAVSGAAIFEGKKSELIQISDIIGNKAANVGRQVYARVPGLNIWENDVAGINLGIGGRGLNPNRTSNFNVRQNGYDISADALGYPESYYTPPVQALERIELVRGAAGLQFGTQFGGMLNFIFREGPKDKKIELTSNQTYGSFGLFNSFNSVGGTVGKLNYYGFYQFKTSDGWRPSSHQNQHNFFASATYAFNPFLTVKVEHTHMTYQAQQPGGLTDDEFETDPSLSKRSRNWFAVGWDLSALEWNYRVSNKLKFNNRTFLLNANRYAVGNLEFINDEDDLSENRNLMKDEYFNWGNELRAVYHYNLFGQKSVLLVGNRLYFGNTDRKQGQANSDSEASFDFVNEEEDYSSYLFPNVNISAFVENIFNLSPKLSVTPGVRFEYIGTNADGFYNFPKTDFAGNVIGVDTREETRENNRQFFILGLGASFKTEKDAEIYGNISQNYKAINFNDIRVINPSLTVDPDISDEFGYNADLGYRGKSKWLNYDMSLFYLRYNDRIGSINSSETGSRYRTNVGDAHTYGLESYLESDLIKFFNDESDNKLITFINLATIGSEYLASKTTGIIGNKVELVPLVNFKTGVTYRYKEFALSALYSHLSEQYCDATNATQTITAVDGIIPAYSVVDLSASYQWKKFSFEGGVNNLLNNNYFTRRAAGYPGPGIIPANPRNFYLGAEVKF